MGLVGSTEEPDAEEATLPGSEALVNVGADVDVGADEDEEYGATASGAAVAAVAAVAVAAVAAVAAAAAAT